MFTTKSFLAVAVVSMVMLQQCANTTPPDYEKLFGLPVDQQAEEFKKYALEQQVDIYVYAIQAVEPPATQFGTFLARNGKKVVPLLLHKVEEENTDRLRFYFIEVLYDMHTENCSLKNEPEVIDAIRTAISQMKDPSYRHLCEMSLKSILEQPGANGPCQ